MEGVSTLNMPYINGCTYLSHGLVLGGILVEGFCVFEDVLSLHSTV